VREARSHSSFIVAALVVLSWSLGAAAPAHAQKLQPQERLCDPTFQDCRADILTYIQQETVEIDMAFWMMTDARYSNALVAASNRGVKIRLLMDPRCSDAHEKCAPQNDQLAAAGIPMRKRITSGILHWKMALFAGQGQLEFAGANYAPFELTPEIPYVNFTDEIVFYTNTPALVQSFMRKFDDLWVSTTEFGTYANITAPLARSFPTYAIDPQLNFPPDQSYRSRALAAYAGEQQAIDVLMFRITDEQHTNAMIAALGRHVPVRLITDEQEYRNPDRLWDSYNVDKMFNAGVQVRFDGHQGINHEKGILLRGTGMTIFGSSNWTSPSSDSQREHNMFTTQPWIFDWLEAQFNRKWSNTTGNQETKPFVPLPPDTPAYHLPANGATGVATSGVSLSWNSGLWAHKYDIYFGTTSNPPLLSANVPLGPTQFGTDYRTFALPTLQPGTTYFWKITSKTMALVPKDGVVWSFTTAGGTPPPTTLPAGWNDLDVGATGAQGSANVSNGTTFNVSGAGADVWGTADAFNYAYRTMNGDGTIVARVLSIQAINAWTKAGVMIRSSLSPGAAQGFMLIAASSSKGANYQRRLADDNISVGTAGPLVAAPRWVKLTRAGNVISAYQSPDGSNWSLIASDTFTMPAGVLVGLAVSSHVTGTNATASFDNVSITAAGGAPPPNSPPTVSITSPTSGFTTTAPATITIAASASDSDGTVSKVDFFANGTALGTSTSAPYSLGWSGVPAGTYSLTAVATDNDAATKTSAAVSITVNGNNPPPGLPAGWSHADIGTTGTTGNASFSSGTFSVTGSGADVWGTADQLHFAYTPLSGDGTIIARVASIQFVANWTKAGVMIRNSLSPSAAQAFMLVAASPAKGVNFQRRLSDGDISVGTTGSLSTAPRWIKLVRAGNVISAYESADGVNWTLVASDTFVMGPDVLIGLAVSSHVTGTNATATFSNVSIQ
jgi:phosphatidylserine/phosphatidylglycerophosphate/cardiolipin synthase-like enzyme/regulation of enolase protein 1 (concanavalin A-like superfamily)